MVKRTAGIIWASKTCIHVCNDADHLAGNNYPDYETVFNLTNPLFDDPKRVEMSLSNRIDDHDSQVHFTPKEAWMTGGLTTEFMGTTMGTTTAGALMSFNFTGTGVEVYGSPSLYLASPAVLNLFTIDGGAPVQWSQDPRAWSGPSSSVKMFSARELQYGAHALVMKVTAQGSGTWIDYLEVAANDSSQITTMGTSAELTSSSRFNETPTYTRSLPSISIPLPPSAPTTSFAPGASRITTNSAELNGSPPLSTTPSTILGEPPVPSILTISITSEATGQASAGVAKHSLSPGVTAGIAVGAIVGSTTLLEETEGEKRQDGLGSRPVQRDKRYPDALVDETAIERPSPAFPVIYNLLGNNEETYGAATILRGAGGHQPDISHLNDPPPYYAS
ncbi:hypothetical protein PQX77_011484 [Marasmius sp. AFHP31]|nr:hypothetical protein PQX77_011484 [Marasmius sp. AFHP31]